MDFEYVFGKAAYYVNEKIGENELIKLINYGAQLEDNALIMLTEEETVAYANRHAFSMFHSPEDLEMLYGIFSEWKRDMGIEEGASSWCRIYKYEGVERLYKVRYRHILDEESLPVGHVYIIQNLSDVIDNEMGEQYRLTHDDLTHLYNKEGFFNGVRKLLQKDTETKYVIIFSNIKDFKLINQLFGLEKGNDILLNMAEMLAQRVKDGDVYGRLNGDHFALCMPKERFDTKIFKHAVKELTGRLVSNSYSIHMQIGVYEIVDRKMDISLMCDRAYMACKSIKRDNVCEIAWYSDDMLVNALLEKEKRRSRSCPVSGNDGL